ncbi:MAG: CheR family methyltransferase [Planctomycetota bacterium]|jgi:chemotaxis protein methyltransferase CheR
MTDSKPISVTPDSKAAELSPADFDFVRTLVERRAAIVLDDGKEYLATTRLKQLASKEGFESLTALLKKLRMGASPDLTTKVVEAMTTNETSFFRDLKPFEALRQDVLPYLVEARGSVKRLNFWCGAASTGQESYSVLMLIAEHFPQLLDWKLDFVATDISTEVLEKAREGVYTQFEVNRGLPAQMLVKYFESNAGNWQFKNPLRSRVDFQMMNLIEPWPKRQPLDIVFLRNVLIYFDADVKRQILAKIREAMAPDGFLFLGGAESTVNLDSSFKPVRTQGTTIYRLASHED